MSETSTPYTPASTSTTVAGNETVSLADEIKKYDTAKLIEYLQGQGLGLSETAIKILEEEEVDGCAFLKMTKQDFRDINVKGGPAVKLVEFAKECKEKKLKPFSSYRSLKEVGKIWYWLRWYRHYPNIFSTDPRNSRHQQALRALCGEYFVQDEALRVFGSG